MSFILGTSIHPVNESNTALLRDLLRHACPGRRINCLRSSDLPLRLAHNLKLGDRERGGCKLFFDLPVE